MFGCPKTMMEYQQVVSDVGVTVCRFRERLDEGDV